MPVKMTQVQLRKHARDKDLQCFLLPAAYVAIARGGTPLQEANRDVPLDGVAFSQLE